MAAGGGARSAARTTNATFFGAKPQENAPFPNISAANIHPEGPFRAFLLAEELIFASLKFIFVSEK